MKRFQPEDCGIYAADGVWYIFSGPPNDGTAQWWCGEHHGWVSPNSSYYHMDWNCWAEQFKTHEAALKKLKWILSQ